MGGQDGSRGCLYQSIISVLSACMTNDWNYISVEYKTESDKVDIAFSKEQTITKVIQVKSSINLFKKATIKQWMKEIKSDVISEEYEIILIGNCGQDTNVFIKDIANYNRGEIGTKKITDFEDITKIIKDKNFKIKLIPFDQDHLMSIVRDNVNRWIFTKGYAVDPISLEQLVLALVSLTTFWGTEGIQVKKDTYENKIFENKIVPLLQEYFYDDYEKIQLVLGDNQKPDDSTRFIIKKTDALKLFGDADVHFPDYYEINSEAFMRIDAYAFL